MIGVSGLQMILIIWPKKKINVIHDESKEEIIISQNILMNRLGYNIPRDKSSEIERENIGYQVYKIFGQRIIVYL